MSGIDDVRRLDRLQTARERSAGIGECEIHDILRNWRRQMVISELNSSVRSMTLNELAETLAEAETGESPPPRNARKSVYSALHQSHLPKLDSAGVVRYDTNRKTVSLGPRARAIDPYTGVMAPYGVAWEAHYRRLSLLTLVALAGAKLDIAVFAGVSVLPLLGASLTVVTASTTYQLWSDRFRLLRFLVD